MKGIKLAEHPLVRQCLTRLRDASTTPPEFRRLLAQLTTLLVYEATRDLETRPVRVRTPVAAARGMRLKRRILLVPILRAGLGMLDPVLDLIPNAVVGFIGLRRNEQTLQPENYHVSTPARLGSFDVLLIDPMLATGGSALAALEEVYGRGAQRVRLVNVLAAPEGLRAVRKQYPRLPIYSAAIDERLNDKGFIVPGLGDAGDRLFGT
jgi:uracil phosphoribosyltransferase